jgi:hypothetical protein
MTTNPGFLRRRDVLKGAALVTGGLAFPLVSTAQATSATPIYPPVNPNGQAYIKSPADTGSIGRMYAHPIYPSARLCDVGAPPPHIQNGHSRLTFAVDVCAVDGYYSSPSNHIVIAARVNPNDPLDDFGGSAWQGTIAGELWGQARVMSEVRKHSGNITGGDTSNPPPPDKGWATGNNAVVPHHWYRFVVDSVKWQGSRMFECRVYDVADELNNTLGALLYQSPSLYFPDVGYADTNTVMFANVSGSTSSLIVGRVAAYWTHATEWVANP